MTTTSAKPDLPVVRYIAWTRTPPSRRWERVASASTEWEARDKVFLIPATGRSRDVVVLPEGRDPNTRGKTR